MRETEGDAWYERNKEGVWQLARQPTPARKAAWVARMPDPVCDLIEAAGLEPSRIMEIGCCDGWRLDRLRHRYPKAQLFGIEPSKAALSRAWQRSINAHQRTAEKLPSTRTNWADLLIYGFCLYLTDPEDWLRIAAEGDRVLKPGGHLIVHDFHHEGRPHAVPYRHREGMLSYHFDFTKLWLGSPFYTMVRRLIDGDNVVTLLKKLPYESIEVIP